jgi:hypothetical protein
MRAKIHFLAAIAVTVTLATSFGRSEDDPKPTAQEVETYLRSVVDAVQTQQSEFRDKKAAMDKLQSFFASAMSDLGAKDDPDSARIRTITTTQYKVGLQAFEEAAQAAGKHVQIAEDKIKLVDTNTTQGNFPKCNYLLEAMEKVKIAKLDLDAAGKAVKKASDEAQKELTDKGIKIPAVPSVGPGQPRGLVMVDRDDLHLPSGTIAADSAIGYVIIANTDGAKHRGELKMAVDGGGGTINGKTEDTITFDLDAFGTKVIYVTVAIANKGGNVRYKIRFQQISDK